MSVRRLAIAATLVHPAPSIICAALAAAIALVAGGAPATAALLAVGMLGFQCSIGAVNDLVDAPADLAAGRPNPVSLSVVPVGVAHSAAVAGGVVGIGLSAWLGPMVLAAGLAGYACGLAYDLFMRERGLGWLCFIPAFALLPAWSWLAVTGHLPPDYAVVVVLAALAGPALHLANDLADPARDAPRPDPVSDAAGRPVILVALLSAAVYIVAWALLLARAGTPQVALGLALVATLMAALGVVGSASHIASRRELGWIAQAAAMSLLAVAWLGSIA